MHDSAFRIGELVMQTYCDLPNARILEIGSMDVNGSLRRAAAPTTHYVGVDLEEGPEVDVVVKPSEKLPFDEDSFDLVMASSAFEHDPRFWETFVEMCRVAQPGGHIYVNAPSNGGVHRYPLDCWRFYPDAGLALVDYAQTVGIHLELVESFVGKRSPDTWDGWNDFVAIFRKGPSKVQPNLDFVYKRYPSCNARAWNSSDLEFETSLTEDMRFVRDLRQQLTEHDSKLEATSAELDDLREKVRLAESRAQKHREEVSQHRSEIKKLAKETAEAERLREKLSGDLRISESEIAHLRSAAAGLERQIDTLSAALRAQTDALTFVQARDQAQIESLHAELSSLRSEHLSQLSRLDHASAEITRLRTRGAELDAMVKNENALRVQAERRRESAETETSARCKEVEDLSFQLLQAQRYRVGMEWLRAVHIALARVPFWWSLLPIRSRRMREYQVLRRAGLFDDASYLARYPDVASERADPLRHYITYGMNEGRDRGFS